MVDTQSSYATRTCWHTFIKKEVNEYMLIQATPKTMNSNEILYKSYNKTTKHGKDRSSRNKSHGKRIHTFLQILHLIRKKRTPSKDRECTHHILMNHDASDSTPIIGNNNDDTPNRIPGKSKLM